MERIILNDKVAFTLLPSDKFKRNRISVTFIVPNKKEYATMYAVLPTLMERGYSDYPDMSLFSKKLNTMYGASFSASTSVVGENRTIRFTIQGIKDKYCLNGENLLGEMADVLLGVIFSPCTEDGGFISSWLEVEKVKLKEEIQGEINDKRGYCVKNAQRKFFKDSKNGVERLGYLEDVDKIDPKELYKCYQELISTGAVEIFATADGGEFLKEKFEKAFSGQNQRCDILPVTVMPVCPTETYSESMDIVQGKVCLYYTCTRKITEAERYIMLVASSIFGGTANSRLFKNVREKQSLCYYCAAGFNGFTCSMRVDSGVEHENCQKTIDAVENELKMLIEGDISDEEIYQTKLFLINGLDAVNDALHGLEAWYLNEAIRGTWESTENVKEYIKTVSAEQIKDVLKLLKLNVIYKLTK